MAKFTSRADLLIAAGESIKMQEKAGVNEPAVKYKGEITACDELSYTNPQLCEYEFPLAVVEGKPVFVGDELYWKSGSIYQAVKIHHKEDHFFVSVNLTVFPINEATWNPPKPKTVMVELLREDAEHLVAVEEYFSSTRVAAACRKALDKA